MKPLDLLLPLEVILNCESSSHIGVLHTDMPNSCLVIFPFFTEFVEIHQEC